MVTPVVFVDITTHTLAANQFIQKNFLTFSNNVSEKAALFQDYSKWILLVLLLNKLCMELAVKYTYCVIDVFVLMI